MKRRELLLASLTVIFSNSVLIRAGLSQELGLGRFSGDAILRFVGQTTRKAILVQDFSYRDLTGKLWNVPKGAEVDGASIPKAFFSYIGGPFSDKYREPSIVHDHYCTVKTTSYESAHAVFYEAMLQNGVPSFKAWVMFKAVQKFGPKWPEPLPASCNSGGLIDLAECSQNIDEKEVLTTNTLMGDQVNEFLSDIKNSGVGYAADDFSDLERALKQ